MGWIRGITQSNPVACCCQQHWLKLKQSNAGKAELADVPVERMHVKNSIPSSRPELHLVQDELHDAKKLLRQLAMEVVVNANQADLDSQAMQAIDIAIRRGIDAGLLALGPARQPIELKRQPERPSDTNN